MRFANWKSLGTSVCCALLLAASARAESETPPDDVARRTEQALYRMSQMEAGNKKIRVVTPNRPVAAQAPVTASPSDVPPERPLYPTPTDRSAYPMPQADPSLQDYEGSVHEPTLFDDCSGDLCGDCCEDLCCDCLCGPPGTFWVRTEVLGWWTKGQNSPPLVTTGPDNSNPGVIGEPGTEILFGGGRLNEKGRIGGRISAGAWLDNCHIWGIEGDYFGLDDSDQGYFATGFDYPFLSRPFVDVTNGLPGDNAVEAVNNDDLCGDILVAARSSFQGAGASFRRNLCCTTSCCDTGHNPLNCEDWSADCFRMDMIFGYRFYRLNDSIYVNERLMSIDDGGPIAFGTTFNIFDDFRTRNEFHGGEIGLIGTRYRGRWSVEGLVKVALGNNHSQVRIKGATTTTVPGQTPNTLPGGLLALPSNIGVYDRDDFAVIPQFGVKLGYQCNSHLRLLVGYDFLLWSNVSRAGDQIDTRVDTDQLPPGTSGTYPEFTYRDTTFWAQGISGGVEVRW